MTIKTQSEWTPWNRIGQSRLIITDPFYQWYFPRTQSIRQETFSESHSKNKAGNWKSGGPFLTRKVSVQHYPMHGFYDQGGTGPIRRVFDSLIFVDLSSATSLALPVAPPASTMTALGTKGIATFSPTTPQAGLGQAIAELHQAPSLPDLRNLQETARRLFSATPRKMRNRNILQQSGNEYLNFTFGWLPFFHDLKDFYNALRHHKEKSDRLRRNSGRNVRRHGTLLNDGSTTSTQFNENFTYGYPAEVTQMYGSNFSTVTEDVSSHTKGWFSGSFTYFLPPPAKADGDFRDEVRENLAMLRILYGIEVTPSMLWELTPWSWLADWCVNIGDNVRNFSNFIQDGLILHYGYAMLHVETKTVRTRRVVLRNQSVVTPKVEITSYTKTRDTASPFGFGWNPGTATARQGAIIAALAASKA